MHAFNNTAMVQMQDDLCDVGHPKPEALDHEPSPPLLLEESARPLPPTLKSLLWPCFTTASFPIGIGA